MRSAASCAFFRVTRADQHALSRLCPAQAEPEAEISRAADDGDLSPAPCAVSIRTAALCHGLKFAARFKLRHNKTLMTQVQIFPIPGLPEISEGDDLAHLIVDLVHDSDIEVADGDVFVVAQKIVSKAEGRVVRLDSITPSERARDWAREWAKDARVVELVLREAKRIVKMERGVSSSPKPSTASSAPMPGVDVSNAEEGTAILLPEESGRVGATTSSATCDSIRRSCRRHRLPDTFGRAWRGPRQCGVGRRGFGAADRLPRPYRTPAAKIIQATIIAIADEIALAAELAMGKAERVPVAIVRGARLGARSGSGADLIRPAEKDLFR